MSVVERGNNADFWGLVQQKGPWRMTAQDYKHQSSARGSGGTSLGRGGTLHSGHGSYSVKMHPYQISAQKPGVKMSKWAQRSVITKPLNVNLRKPVPGYKFIPLPSLFKGVGQTLKGLGTRGGPSGVDQGSSGNDLGGTPGAPASQTPGLLAETEDGQSENEINAGESQGQPDVEPLPGIASIYQYFDTFANHEGRSNSVGSQEVIRRPRQMGSQTDAVEADLVNELQPASQAVDRDYFRQGLETLYGALTTQQQPQSQSYGSAGTHVNPQPQNQSFTGTGRSLREGESLPDYQDPSSEYYDGLGAPSYRTDASRRSSLLSSPTPTNAVVQNRPEMLDLRSISSYPPSTAAPSYHSRDPMDAPPSMSQDSSEYAQSLRETRIFGSKYEIAISPSDSKSSIYPSLPSPTTSINTSPQMSDKLKGKQPATSSGSYGVNVQKSKQGPPPTSPKNVRKKSTGSNSSDEYNPKSSGSKKYKPGSKHVKGKPKK